MSAHKCVRFDLILVIMFQKWGRGGRCMFKNQKATENIYDIHKIYEFTESIGSILALQDKCLEDRNV